MSPHRTTQPGSDHALDSNVFDLDWRTGGRKPSLSELAYERIEELFVSTRLAPGSFVRTQDLQTLVGLGRTPVHQAVRRLAAETLIDVRPRDGLTIAPVDLTRERRLVDLRRELDRFVIEEAAAKLSSNHRAGLLHLRRALTAHGDAVDVGTFNLFDRSFDALMITAAGERFLERSLRPLHAFGRRVGHLHLTHISAEAGLKRTIACHLAILDAVVAADVPRAKAASNALVDLSIYFIDGLAASADPGLLDASLMRGGMKTPAEASEWPA